MCGEADIDSVIDADILGGEALSWQGSLSHIQYLNIYLAEATVCRSGVVLVLSSR